MTAAAAVCTSSLRYAFLMARHGVGRDTETDADLVVAAAGCQQANHIGLPGCDTVVSFARVAAQLPMWTCTSRRWRKGNYPRPGSAIHLVLAAHERPARAVGARDALALVARDARGLARQVSPGIGHLEGPLPVIMLVTVPDTMPGLRGFASRDTACRAARAPAPAARPVRRIGECFAPGTSAMDGSGCRSRSCRRDRRARHSTPQDRAPARSARLPARERFMTRSFSVGSGPLPRVTADSQASAGRSVTDRLPLA